MNEHGEQPLGESPDVTIATVSRRIDGAVEKLRKVTRLHEHMYTGDTDDCWQYCKHCCTVWPCETMKIVEAVEL